MSLAASFTLPHAFSALPFTCWAAPSTCVLVSPVHSPTCRFARPAASSIVPLMLSLFIPYTSIGSAFARAPCIDHEFRPRLVCHNSKHKASVFPRFRNNISPGGGLEYRPSSRDKLQDQHDHRRNQQQMNKP